MNIFGKKISEIVHNDIKQLVDTKTPESTYLDYKREIDFTPEGKAELGKDVSAFANTEGGTLVLGVEERRMKEKGKLVRVEPGNICGIPQVHKQQETGLWLEQTVKSNTRRIVRTSIQPVEIPGNEHNKVFVIYVPKSNHAPHMVSSGENTGRYFKRRNFQNEIAEEYEVRELFERSARLEVKLNQYLSLMRHGLRPGNPADDWYNLSFVCCPTILDDRLIDITEKDRLLIDKPAFVLRTPEPSESARLHPSRQYVISAGEATPSIWGLTIRERNQNLLDQERKLNVHRNGYMEFVTRVPKADEGGFYVGRWAIGLLLGFMDYCTKVLSAFQYHGNVLVLLGINRSVFLHQGGRDLPIVERYPGKRHILINDEVFIGDLHTDLYRTLRPLADQFFNIFGIEKADCFDEDDNYIG